MGDGKHDELDSQGRRIYDDEGNPRYILPTMKDGVEVDGEGNEVQLPGAEIMSKHIAAWRDSYGGEAVDAAIKLEGDKRKAADKAAAAQARGASGKAADSAPSGRSAEPKAKAST